MIKIRAKFKKENELIYISHLDLMRLFQRAFRRADIPVKYSEGFNPHPKFSFATALAIGVSSIGEYLDIELEYEIDLEEFVLRMNDVLPKGIEILKASYLKEQSSVMSIINWSTYAIQFSVSKHASEQEIEEEIQKFLNKEEIIITKEKKKGKRVVKREVNIRDLIKNINILMLENDKVILKTTLKTGSKGNLKPSLLIDSMKKLTNIDIQEDSVKIHRLELFLEKNGILVPPL